MAYSPGTSDRRLLYAAAFLRSLATGACAVLLGLYLAKLELDPTRIGVVIAAGLAGGAAATAAVTAATLRASRRSLLLGLAALAGAGGLALAAASDTVLLGLFAFLGMANGMGRDRGAALVLEQAILPATLPAEHRTRAFAAYNVFQDAGHALGGLLAGLPSLLRVLFPVGELSSLRLTLSAAALLALATAPLYLRLSPAVEAPAGQRTLRVSPESRRVLWKISSLFALDSFAGGFLTTSFLAYYFHERFGAGEAAIGLLFMGARLANALSHLGAAWLAARIGLVNTMVFTHIPSSLLLVTVLFAPSFAAAAALFLLREGLVEMDVPTRQSYVMAVVRPEERVVASSVTHLVRLGAWAAAPSVAGLLMGSASMAAPFLLGAGMKISYDVLLYLAFRRTRPPEER